MELQDTPQQTPLFEVEPGHYILPAPVPVNEIQNLDWGIHGGELEVTITFSGQTDPVVRSYQVPDCVADAMDVLEVRHPDSFQPRGKHQVLSDARKESIRAELADRSNYQRHNEDNRSGWLTDMIEKGYEHFKSIGEGHASDQSESWDTAGAVKTSASAIMVAATSLGMAPAGANTVEKDPVQPEQTYETIQERSGAPTVRTDGDVNDNRARQLVDLLDLHEDVQVIFHGSAAPDAMGPDGAMVNGRVVEGADRIDLYRTEDRTRQQLARTLGHEAAHLTINRKGMDREDLLEAIDRPEEDLSIQDTTMLEEMYAGQSARKTVNDLQGHPALSESEQPEHAETMQSLDTQSDSPQQPVSPDHNKPS